MTPDHELFSALFPFDRACLFPVGTDKLPRVAWGSLEPGEKVDPGAGAWGLATGLRSAPEGLSLVVIDLDVKGGDGWGELERLERTHGTLPRTLLVETRSGGGHLYFFAPSTAAIRNSAGTLARSIDVRGEGGYVVGPGSPGYRIVERAPVAMLPPPWIALLSAPPTAAAPAAPPPAPGEGSTIPLDDLRAAAKGRHGPVWAAIRDAAAGERFVRVRGGTKGPDRGPVDELLTRVLYALAAEFPDSAPEAAAEVLRPSLSLLREDDLAAGNPTYSDADVTDKFARALAKTRAEKAADRALSGALEAAAKAAEVSGPAILQFRRSFYLACPTKGYVGPYAESEVWGQARDRGTFPVVAPTKSGTRPLRVAEMVEAYGVGGALDAVEIDLTLRRAIHDRDRRALRVPGAAIRHDLAPGFSARVHAWLEALGGDALLDWVACVPDLSEAIPALWICGSRNVGKTLLAAGLARLWGAAPLPLEKALGRFNHEIVGMPFILGDERIPRDSRGHPMIEDLKSLITDTRRQVEPKGLPLVPVKGAVRVLLASNNSDMIRGSRDMTPDDAAALADRFVYLEPDPSRIAPTLDPHRHEIQTRWIDGDEIASHALYLSETRTPARGPRLRLPPHAETFRRALAIQPGGGFVILQTLYDWVISAAAAVEAGSSPNAAGDVGISWSSGTVLATPRGIRARTQSDRRDMHDRTLADTLRRISRGRRGDAWEIDPENLRAWAATEAWGSLERLQRAFDVLNAKDSGGGA